MRCSEFASFLPIFAVSKHLHSKHLHSYGELHLLLFIYCFIFLFLAQATLKYINQHDIFLQKSPKQTKASTQTSPPFQKISEVSSSFLTCKWTISILLKKLSGSSNCLFQPWLLLVCFALVLSFVCLLLWVLHSIEMTADSDGNGDFFFSRSVNISLGFSIQAGDVERTALQFQT